MAKFFSVFALAILLTGCSGDRETAVVDASQMTPEQQASHDAYVDEMNGPGPDEQPAGATAPAAQ